MSDPNPIDPSYEGFTILPSEAFDAIPALGAEAFAVFASIQHLAQKYAHPLCMAPTPAAVAAYLELPVDRVEAAFHKVSSHFHLLTPQLREQPRRRRRPY